MKNAYINYNNDKKIQFQYIDKSLNNVLQCFK